MRVGDLLHESAAEGEFGRRAELLRQLEARLLQHLEHALLVS